MLLYDWIVSQGFDKDCNMKSQGCRVEILKEEGTLICGITKHLTGVPLG